LPREGQVPIAGAKVVYIPGRFSHVDIDHIGRMIHEAQQFGPFIAKLYHFPDDGFIVKPVVVVTAHQITTVNLLTQIPAFGILQERDHAGFLKGKTHFPCRLSSTASAAAAAITSSGNPLNPLPYQ
jgi:hypothetical protein